MTEITPAPARTTPQQQQQQQQHTSNSSNNTRNQKKRKRPASADAFTRVAASTTTRTGRGSEAGWTHCPLCGRHSKKLFAQGRGIAAHLHAVHTPWKPGKVERQKRRRLAERKRRDANCKQAGLEETTFISSSPTTNRSTSPLVESSETWEPTDDEIDEWNKRVLQIVKELEEQQILLTGATSTSNITVDASPLQQDTTRQPKNASNSTGYGVDRNGQVQMAYRASLPPLLQAAADGSLEALQAIMDSQNDDQGILEELKRTDRHQSTAEHWAAGGGHLECLTFLLETRKRVEGSATSTTNHHNTSSKTTIHEPPKKVRRRDGKTCLHYAARNGHVNCIDYLIREHGHTVDETSGDGTTPFHLACFGGHLKAMEAFLDQYACRALHANDFGCNAAHWLGMTKKGAESDTETVRTMCQLLQSHGVSFVERQKQGHTACHKAAQRQNRHVIEWLAQTKEEGGAGLSEEEKRKAGQPDEGGHTPSQIWRSVGGDETFANWMKLEMRW